MKEFDDGDNSVCVSCSLHCLLSTVPAGYMRYFSIISAMMLVHVSFQLDDHRTMQICEVVDCELASARSGLQRFLLQTGPLFTSQPSSL